MKTKQIKIVRVGESEIVLSDEVASEVLEYFPEDCGQKNEVELNNYFAKMHQYLLNYKNENAKFKTFRFSFLSGKTFINAEKDFFESFPLPTLKNSEFMSYFLGDETFENSTIINCEDFVKINGTYFRVFSLFPNFPETISDNYFSAIGDYVVQFKKVNQSSAISKMEFKRNIFNSSRYKEKKDVEGNNAYYEAENFLEGLKNGHESMYMSEFFLLVKAKTELELFDKSFQLKKILNANNISYLLESESLTEIFPSLMFGLEASFIRSLPVDTAYLLNLLPLTSDFIHNDGSKFYSVENQENEVFIDIFHQSSHNYNTLVIGPSGNGKSWLVQKMSKDLLERDIGGIIFDLGSGHLKYCLYYNAKIFSSKFNPMQFKDPTYLHALILSVIPEGELDFKQRGLILKKIRASESKEIHLFSELISFIEEDLPGFSLYFEEIFPFITDDFCPIEKLVYVDTGAYPDTIKAPLIIFLFEYFEHIEGKKIFVFDECWKFLKSVGWFIQERFRTLRKKGAAAIAISQGFDEFLSTEMGRAIVDNCFHKFIFQQDIKKNEILTEFDIQSTLKVRSEKGVYSEFYYKSANHKKRLRCFGSAREKELFSSEKDDNLRMENYFSTLGSGHSFQTLFDTYMKTFYPGMDL